MSDEQQPLLKTAHILSKDAPQATEVASNLLERRSSNEEHNAPTPLPKRQISILLLMQLSEPIAYSVIYPFIARLVNETGVTGGDESKIGYYAGMIESIFFLTESLFTLQYGRVSDRIGRRPVLMFGLFGQAISIFCVGLSKRYWQLVFSRALSGALNGNTGVSKSMVAELTNETNQAQAFAFMPIVWSTGSTLGPFLAGTLSHPAEVLPSVFDTPFWNKYPYFLPCLIAAIYAACVFVFGALFLKEAIAESQDCPPQPKRSVPVRSVLTKRARIAIANYAALAFTDITYLALLPVMFAVSVKGGGLGFDSRSIGLILGLQGITTGLVQACFFAPLHRRFGSKRILVTGYLCYLLLIISLPIMHTFAATETRWAVWVLIVIHIAISCPAFMTFSCMAIYVNTSAPSKDSLGTLNGISQTTISIIRAIGPVTATSLFSLSVQKNILGGNLIYGVLLVMCLVALYASQSLKQENRAYE
ncbi:unnamed protein product [Rhizoctonia solani]|uniref:Major facilitator superfamily (MFS) profile domain-containing protein n=1 Tax=Rhizoctonia solani TaxID=456999 RepID=A0A8H3GDV4_9AGAM|nr:unnamed protein product [Rhizoctonia solani]